MIYVGKRLGKGWGVGTRVKDKEMLSCFAFIIIGIFVILGLVLQNIAITIPIIIIIIVITIWRKKCKKKQARLYEASQLGLKAAKYVDNINNLKTTQLRLNNIPPALELINQIKFLDPNGEIIDNIDSIICQLAALEKTLPVEDFLEKSEKAKFKNNKKAQLNYLLEAIYLCRQVGITNNDFKINNRTEINNNQQIITIESIEDKAKVLGWEERKFN